MKIVKVITLSCIATLAACGGGGKSAAPASKPVATVNGKGISRETFEYVGIDASVDTVQRVLGQANARDDALASHMTSSDQGANVR